MEASDYENGTDDPEGFEANSEVEVDNRGFEAKSEVDIEDGEDRNAATVLATFAAMSAAIFAIAF